MVVLLMKLRITILKHKNDLLFINSIISSFIFKNYLAVCFENTKINFRKLI